jgi:hypothetical protein
MHHHTETIKLTFKLKTSRLINWTLCKGRFLEEMRYIVWWSGKRQTKLLDVNLQLQQYCHLFFQLLPEFQSQLMSLGGETWYSIMHLGLTLNADTWLMHNRAQLFWPRSWACTQLTHHEIHLLVKFHDNLVNIAKVSFGKCTVLGRLFAWYRLLQFTRLLLFRWRFSMIYLLHLHVSMRIPLVFDFRPWRFTSHDGNFTCQLSINFKCPIESQWREFVIHDPSLVSHSDTLYCTTVCKVARLGYDGIQSSYWSSDLERRHLEFRDLPGRPLRNRVVI